LTLPSAASLTDDLLALGVRPGGVLLVHSSLRSLGPLPDGAETAVQGLLETLGPQGSLLMPALSYASVGAGTPFFDARATLSCVGALPEYFRTRPGTLRSVHPTHSVSGVGRLANDLLDEQIRSTTPCGPCSPFAKLPEVNGQILFLGCGLRPNTSMHAIEERVEPPYLYGEVIEYQVTLADGSRQTMRVRSHNFKGWVQRYDRVSQVLAAPELRQGKVLQADCWLVEAAALWPAALGAYRQNPLYFVDPQAG
jgi:aminoglycoside 3-N-acetyltransferase